MVVPIVAVWFDAYRRLLAVTGGYKLRPASFAPAEAGARADLRGYAAPVGSQAYCDRLVFALRVCWGSLLGGFQLQLHLCSVATNGSGRSPTARLARNANPCSGATCVWHGFLAILRYPFFLASLLARLFFSGFGRCGISSSTVKPCRPPSSNSTTTRCANNSCAMTRPRPLGVETTRPIAGVVSCNS